jgi:hypothetical protein
MRKVLPDGARDVGIMLFYRPFNDFASNGNFLRRKQFLSQVSVVRAGFRTT